MVQPVVLVQSLDLDMVCVIQQTVCDMPQQMIEQMAQEIIQ